MGEAEKEKVMPVSDLDKGVDAAKDTPRGLPKWCDITDWDGWTVEKAQFIHAEASRCFDDVLAGYASLKQRCEALFMLAVTGLSGLAGFAVYALEPAGQATRLAVAASIGAGVPLLVAAALLWRQLFCHRLPLAGNPPRHLMVREVIEDQPIEHVIFSQSLAVQDQIDEAKQIKRQVAGSLRRAMLLLLLTPVCGLVAVALVAMWP